MQLVENYLSEVQFTTLTEQEFKLIEPKLLLEMETLAEKTALQEKKIKKTHDYNIKSMRKYLKSHGIDVSKIDKMGKAASKKLVTAAKQEKDPKVIAKEIISKINELIQLLLGRSKVADEIRKEKEKQGGDIKEENMETWKAVLVSIVGCIILLYINSFLVIAAISLFGPMIGSMVGTIVVAPLVEEFMKRIAVQMKIPYKYTGIFAGFEFILYISRFLAMGMTMPVIFAFRIPPVIMHFVTTFIQKKMHERGEGDPKSSSSQAGYLMAVVFHSVYNDLAVIYNKEILRFVYELF